MLLEPPMSVKLPPTQATTLAGLLRARAAERGEREAFLFLADGGQEGARLTYGELDRRARAIALALRESLQPGDRALLLYPPGLEFIAAFFGCLYAGVIAVPAYPPRLSDRSQARLRSIALDARPGAALTTSPILAAALNGGLLARVPELGAARWIATDELAGTGAGDEGELPEPGPDAVAFLQYTSGSTAAPKGVMVTHANLLHNEGLIGEAFRQDEDSVVVGWLPLYHDMGLIGNVLQPVHAGARCVLMSPVAFLQKPLRWLEAIDRYRGTSSGGPNFAYELCARRIGAEDRERLDLSSWRLAFNGAEPVRAETLKRFAEAFAPSGFRREAFYPCYGLAEATLFVSGGQAGNIPRVEIAETGRPLTSCGRVWGGQRIVIADPETGSALPPGREGEIWIAGESVAAGYWNNPEATERDFRARLAGTGEGPFLRTGDLGFLRGGELYVTGRLKDLIILRGRNHYPQDIELTAERSHPDLRPGGGAAFSVEAGGEERLVVVQEVERGRRESFEELAEAIRRAVAEEHEVQVHEVTLVRVGSVPKTSSGKVQRLLCRERWLAGELAVLGRSALAAEAAQALAVLPGRDALLALAPDERRAALELALRERAAVAVGVDAVTIDPGRPLTAFGLDSLAALELKGSVESALGVELPLAEMLEGAGTARLADLLLAGLNERAIPAPVLPGIDDGHLSYGQKALWFLERLAPEGAYNIAVAARVRGGLDPAALRRALERLTERHAALRTVFRVEGDEPVRRVLDQVEIDFLVEDGWSPERLASEAYRPFSLESGPLFRVRLLGSVLLLSVHHIVADFTSLAVLARDLGALYRQETLPPVAASYGDFARWQEAMLAGPRGEKLWAYWRQALAGVPDLDLPADRPRPPVLTWNGAARYLELPPALADGVRALGSPGGATLFMTLMAAFQVQLGRYSGQRDFAVGSPTAGRSAPEHVGVAGYFVNPVAVRADLSGDPGFDGLLDRVRRTALAGLEHADFPFALAAERLRPERDPARSPIFQTLLVVQRPRAGDPPGLALFFLGEDGGRLNLGGLELESLRLEERRAQFDLSLRAAELPSGGLGLSLEVNVDLFDGATVGRMLGHLRTLLEGAAADPGRPISALPLLTPAERRQVLVDLNVTPAPAAPGLLHRRFEERAARRPDAEALVDGTARLSYGELNRRANRLAHHLRSLGVGPEVRLGVRLKRSADLVVTLLAVLKSGGAYVPLDPAYPEERLALMAEDSGAAMVIAEPVGEEFLAAQPDGDPEPAAVPENLAYLIYTSGSTGRPKAVAIEHRSASVMVAWARGVFSPEELGGVLAATSVSFDVSVFELFVPLSWGGRVILAENALALPRLPAAGEVTLVTAVPSAMAELVRGGGLPPSVRTVSLPGEPVPPALVTAVQAVPGVERIYNFYGPSEDTTYSTIARLAAGRDVTIGRPLDGTRAYVLDAGMELLPAGVPGELYLAGAGLSRGYLGRPELTADRFVPDPFGGPGARLYRTGDLVRWRPDGELDFLGRVDHQVKVRGFRIELGEIEAALGRHPGLREAVVVARDEGELGKRLVAFLVAKEGDGPPAAELRDFLRRGLPEFMVPSAFVCLEALPLSPNGKVDRRALMRLETSREPDAGVAGGEPRTVLEERLAALMAEALGRERIGIHDSFFDLGGHSLLATRVTARVARELGVELPVSALFLAPTVAKLAERLEQGEASSAPSISAPRRERSVGTAPYEAPRSPIEKRLTELWAAVLGYERVGIHDDFFDLGGHSLLGARLILEVREAFGVDLPLAELFDARTPAVLAEILEAMGADSGAVKILETSRAVASAPLSFAQRRLWFLDQLAPGSAAYHIPGVLTLAGPLRPELLAAALAEIVRRHDTLRTVFVVERAEPVQAVLPVSTGAWVLPLADLGALPAAAREGEAARLAATEARRPFDLAAGPLLRALLVRTSADEHRLVVVMHHIVSDGWSLGVMLGELAALYEALAAGRPSPLPALPIQYGEFATAQRRELEGEALDRRLAWWRQRLAGASVLELPTDRARPSMVSDRGAAVRVDFPAGLARGLEGLARGEGATLFMVLLAAWSALLARYSGQEDLTVGTPVAGRDRAEAEPLIGCFVNPLPMRVGLQGDPAFRELLGRARETALGAYDHQGVPFERLVEELAPGRDRGQTPLFQTVLALQSAPRPVRLPDLDISLAEIPTGTAKFDLTLMLAEDREGGIAGTLEFRTKLFEEATARRLAILLGELCAAAAQDPARRLGDLDLLTASERQQILGEWNAREAAYPRDATIHGLFEQQAALRPEAMAAVEAEGGGRLTYGELNARANRLAHRLRRLGVKPEVKVGLLLERSLDLVVAMLATLKAGGAYVPLDPAYPAERLSFLLADSAPLVLVTSRTANLSAAGPRVLILDEEPLAEESANDPEPWATAGGLAHVLYTSGSTGRPKGVEIVHRAVVRLVRPEGESGHARFADDEVFLHMVSPSFDVSILEVWGPLLSGGRLVVMPGRVPALPELEDAIARHGVTTLWLTAGLFHLMVEEGLEALGPLRRLLAGGDVLQPEHVRRALAALPGCELINGYGPTENTTFTCCHVVSSGPEPGETVPVGRPIAGTRVYLLDRWMQPAPVGVPGELCAGGDGLARGYLGRPELTAERFVPDPFGDGGRLYRTGDLARWRPDGTVEFLGRIDQQVKIRGFRIEPGEVETQLAGHPEVAVAAVVPRKDLPGGKGLVAFVVRRRPDGEEAGTPGLATALHAYLQERLPEPMVPELFVELPELPLNANGKVDRRALARLDLVRSGWGGALHVVAPRPPAEEVLPSASIPRAERGAVAPALPLSFAQERLWFLDRLPGAAATYNIPLPARLHGPLRVADLAAAFRAVVGRHETLRTTFPDRDGEPFQRVGPPPAVWPLPLVDLSGLPAAAREGEERALARAEARRPFSLAEGPLLRTLLLRLAPAEHLLLLNVHHIVSDGWSMGLLVRELEALYAAAGGPPRLPELPVQYADFAVWQRRRLSAERVEREVGWWRERLRGLPAALDLPADRPRPAVPTLRGDEVPVALGADLSRDLAALARREGATPFMALFAGFAALLSAWSGQADLAVGSPVAGRDRTETQNLIGFFVNSLVLRLDLSADPDFRSLVRSARQVVLDAYAHQELPFEKLVDALQPRRDLSRTPLFQAVLVLQDVPPPAMELGGLTLQAQPLTTGTAKFDLTLNLREEAGGFVGGLEFATDLFDRAMALRLVDRLRSLLESAVANPELPLSRLSPFSLDERRQPFVTAEPEVAANQDAPAYLPPRDDLERTLAGVWCEVLDLKQVGVRDSFFEIGGNSLAAVRLHSRLCKVLGREIPIVTLFRHPTIESLARSLAEETPAAREQGQEARARTELRRESLRQAQQARGQLRGRKRQP